MISYSDEYSKVYSYKYRKKIYDGMRHPSKLNLNEMLDNENHKIKRVKTAIGSMFSENKSEKDSQNNCLRKVASSYLKSRCQSQEKNRFSNQNNMKTTSSLSMNKSNIFFIKEI